MDFTLGCTFNSTISHEYDDEINICINKKNDMDKILGLRAMKYDHKKAKRHVAAL